MGKSDLEQAFAFQLRAVGLPEGTPQYRCCQPRKWAWDRAWLPQRVAIEIDGGTWVQGAHSRGAGQRRDAEKQNAAVLAGWRVLRATTDMIRDGSAVFALEQLLKGRG